MRSWTVGGVYLKLSVDLYATRGWLTHGWISLCFACHSIILLTILLNNTELPHLKLHCGDAGQPVMPGDGGPPAPADALGRLGAGVLGLEALLEAPRILLALAETASQGGANRGLLRKIPLLAASAALGRMAASSLGEEVCKLLQKVTTPLSRLQNQKLQLHAAWLVVGAHHHHHLQSHQVSQSRLRAEEMGPYFASCHR